jgi:hypothetical protein
MADLSLSRRGYAAPHKKTPRKAAPPSNDFSRGAGFAGAT